MYLAARAVNTLIRTRPSGTASFIGIVLVTLCTGQLVHPQGSLARAALPYVGHLRWGWPRVARAMERGRVALDALFDCTLPWGRGKRHICRYLGGSVATPEGFPGAGLAQAQSSEATPRLGSLFPQGYRIKNCGSTTG